ncbi:CocE/NonD family hydrolase [Bifidobacterium simiarum]|nr:CocE/NonD family hydrolase [Bifidobacterium simiarum]
MVEPIIPEDWEKVDGKLSDFITKTGENANVNDDVPIYKDSKGGIFYLLEEEFQGEKMKVCYRVSRQPVADQEEVDLANSEDPMARMGQGFCPPFNQRTYEAAPGIICEQDQEVVMRDGTKIYCDIYRPVTEEKIPAIVSWSWFGKRPGDGMSEWQIMGVPPKTVSNCAKFESPDPLYWCHQGYAVANVDVRGAGHSEGNVHMFTHQDREDGYDFVEWLAAREWCNGKVGMSGNSGVAMHQWGIAAEQPPHLACIAPWESTTDLYRESLFEGGIPALSFNEFIAAQVTGPNGTDDQVAMARMYPFENAYWRDKMPDFSKVRIPVYQTAGWSHFHLPGSFNAWRRCKSRLKWMRAHRDFEWPDTYQPENLEDLKRFYDRYLKDIHNGWEMTPRVRLDVMDAYDCDYQDRRAEKTFPLQRTEYRKLYFDPASVTLKDAPVADASKASYDPDSGQLEFDYVFDEDTEITGYINLHLFVSCDGYDDMDMFVNIQKASADGEWIPWYTLDEPHPGAWGKCRVSRRKLDEKLSKRHIPVLANESEEKLKNGEIVPVDIAIVPSSRVWHKGERLRVQIAGRYIREGWFEPLAWDTDNHGTHNVHGGGEYESWIEIPVIPPRYQAGDYVVR